MTSAFYIKDVIIIESAAVTLDSKVLLNIKEASDLFGIGQHRLREIVREDYGNTGISLLTFLSMHFYK